MKVSELTGAALDWAVAMANGAAWAVWRFNEFHAIGDMNYSTKWSHAGPIIEREGMHIDCLRAADHYRPAIWEAWPYATGTKHIQQGPTPLIAAMRCYVASTLGDEIDIPDELK